MAMPVSTAARCRFLSLRVLPRQLLVVSKSANKLVMSFSEASPLAEFSIAEKIAAKSVLRLSLVLAVARILANS